VTTQTETAQRPVLVVDFGAQYAQLIARRVREAGVYSEIVPHTATAAEVAAKSPSRSSSPAVRRRSTRTARRRSTPASCELGVPTLGICYGFQVMAQQLGGEVANTGLREYGATDATVTGSAACCWRSARRAERVDEPRRPGRGRAEGFEVLASTSATPVAAFGNAEKCFYGVQWHPEVKHSDYGQDVIENFLHKAAGLPADWNSGNVIAEQVERIRAQVGTGRVLSALSGGVDSAVSTALVHKAVGDQLVAVFVDHGLLRKGEREQVENDYVASTGVRLITVDARETFLDALAGVSDPEQKRKIIGREFIRAFEKVQRSSSPRRQPRAIRSASSCRARSTPTSSSPAAVRAPRTSRATTTSAACPKTCSSSSSSRCGPSSRTRCAQIGRAGPPEAIVARQPFPGPGLGIRIVGEVTADRLEILRDADAIAREELTKRASTARSGSAPSCCSPTCARWACRATAAPTATRSCCARSRRRTR
jgi:GMP synthase (glutamine-hydrolysing)